MVPYVKNEYVIQGDITYINIQYKDTFYQVIIDTNMYEYISTFHWRLSLKKNKFYAVSGQAKNGTQIYMHDICNKTPLVFKGYETDHINGNSLDNRRCNLRVISRQENIDNTKVKCTSKLQIRGVSYDSFHNTYNVDFCFHGNRFFVKPWNNIESAVYCRYCFEKYFNLFIIENNPIALQYIANLTNASKIEIESYVLSKISGN